ncbi:hypothetical protein LTS10_010791 [Elasticomyces elasticus]|nr:hypothetical protein LTS10_010791 [Elasticomyces elasticus]
MEAEQAVPFLRIDWCFDAWVMSVWYPVRHGSATVQGDGELDCSLRTHLSFKSRQQDPATQRNYHEVSNRLDSSSQCKYSESDDNSEISAEVMSEEGYSCTPVNTDQDSGDLDENYVTPLLRTVSCVSDGSTTTITDRARENLPEYDLASGSTSSVQSLQKIKDWLLQCDTHPACVSWHHINGVSPSAPTRLLEVTPAKRHPTIRLDMTDKLHRTPVCYTTLSHCWGRTLNIKLLRKNVRRLQIAIPWNSFPRTFQDAVVVTANLGVRYLWIDSLCIMQDDKQDWAREASRMSAVYINSFLNLTADASTDSHGGLFRKRDSRLVHSFFVPSVHPRPDGREYLCYADSWKEDVEKTQLFSRAWVLQEVCLAPRVVRFGVSQLHWDCVYKTTSEGLPTNYNSDAPRSYKHRLLHIHSEIVKTGLNELYDFWTRTILDYSLRRLTYTSDRSIAVAGLARAFRQYAGLNDTGYVAGLGDPTLLTICCGE